MEIIIILLLLPALQHYHEAILYSYTIMKINSYNDIKLFLITNLEKKINSSFSFLDS